MAIPGQGPLDPVACIIWYKSRPELLDRLLCSLVGRVRGVVMVDGPYQGLASTADSPDDNYTAIARYEHLLNVHVLRGAIYPSEAHKRTKAARMAHHFFPLDDRLLVIDNDEALISPIPTGYPLRAELWQDGFLTASMVRIYPLTASITWGPNHGYVEDHNTVYWDQTHNSFPSEDCHFKILHTPADKRIQAEYDHYNTTTRPGIEGDGKHGWPLAAHV